MTAGCNVLGYMEGQMPFQNHKEGQQTGLDGVRLRVGVPEPVTGAVGLAEAERVGLGLMDPEGVGTRVPLGLADGVREGDRVAVAVAGPQPSLGKGEARVLALTAASGHCTVS